MIAAQSLRKTAQKTRENLAKQVFDPVRVQQILRKAAAEGLPYIRIVQDHPIDLHRSNEAHGLVKQLEKGGYQVFWIAVEIPSKDHPSHAPSIHHEMIIAWSDDFKRWLAAEEGKPNPMWRHQEWRLIKHQSQDAKA